MSGEWDGLRAAAEGATPGPWVQNEPPRQAKVKTLGIGSDLDDEIAVTLEAHDAAYIAAASPDVVLGLLDRVADLEGQLGRTEDQIQERGGFINQTVDQQERLDRVAAVAREWTALGSATVYETAAEMGRVIRDALDGPESDAGVEVALGSSDGALGAQKGGKP